MTFELVTIAQPGTGKARQRIVREAPMDPAR
jgi:hypothetical protein